MTTLREAATMALEALEYGQHSLKQVSEYQWESRGELAMQALRAALAQRAEPVEQMPVGWLESPHGAFRADPLYKMQFPSQLLQWQIALYTAPPQRKPLSADKTMALANETAGANWGDEAHLQRFRAAIERAHGIRARSKE